MSYCLICLPRRLHLWLGWCIGWLITNSNIKRTAIVRSYLDLFQSPMTAMKAYSHHFGVQCLELFLWPYWRSLLKHWVDTDEVFNDMVQQKNPVFLTAHIGNWEILPSFVASFGQIVHCVYKHEPHHFNWLVHFRVHQNIKIWEASTQIRDMLRAWQAGGALGLVCDHGHGLDARILDQVVDLPSGAFRLASRSKNGVYFLWAQRQGLRFKIHTVVLAKPGEQLQSQQLAKRYAKALSDAIQSCPEQYYWRVDPWRLFQHLLGRS